MTGKEIIEAIYIIFPFSTDCPYTPAEVRDDICYWSDGVQADFVTAMRNCYQQGGDLCEVPDNTVNMDIWYQIG